MLQGSSNKLAFKKEYEEGTFQKEVRILSHQLNWKTTRCYKIRLCKPKTLPAIIQSFGQESRVIIKLGKWLGQFQNMYGGILFEY